MVMIKVTVRKNHPKSQDPYEVPATYYVGGFAANEARAEIARYKEFLVEDRGVGVRRLRRDG
jgi:hypothetical protein